MSNPVETSLVEAGYFAPITADTKIDPGATLLASTPDGKRSTFTLPILPENDPRNTANSRNLERYMAAVAGTNGPALLDWFCQVAAEAQRRPPRLQLVRKWRRPGIYCTLTINRPNALVILAVQKGADRGN